MCRHCRALPRLRFSAYREESPTVVGIIEDARRGGGVSGVRRSVESAKYRYLPRFLAESARLSVSAALSGCTAAPSRRRVFRVRLSVSDQAYARQAQPPRTALSVTTAMAFS